MLLGMRPVSIPGMFVGSHMRQMFWHVDKQYYSLVISQFS